MRGTVKALMSGPRDLLNRYKLRLRRKRLLWRAVRKRHEFKCIERKTGSIKANNILLFACLRNEMLRLPFFLAHYRRLGVDQFLLVDNGSDDGSVAFLQDQPDVSLWSANAGYKAARFGMDWLTALQWKHGSGHWCLTVDIDELLIYPDWQNRDLQKLTHELASNGLKSMGALMLDLYPKGPVGDHVYESGDDPTTLLSWFDAYGYWAQLQPKMDNLWVQGGARARLFFAKTPERAPTLNKIPLIHWQRPYTYVNSTHNALPVELNRVYDEQGSTKPNGVLLHTKFLPDAPDRARREKKRGEHFADANLYDEYYTSLAENPDLWCEGSLRYKGWEQLVSLRLLSCGDNAAPR